MTSTCHVGLQDLVLCMVVTICYKCRGMDVHAVGGGAGVEDQVKGVHMLPYGCPWVGGGRGELSGHRLADGCTGRSRR